MRNPAAEPLAPQTPTPPVAPIAASDPPEPEISCPLGTEARTHCLHCGLSLSSDQVAARRLFCCAGCERVHALLRDSGLTRYYDLRPGPGVPPPAPRRGGFAWLEPLLAEAAAAGERPQRITLDLQGVHCAACVWLLETTFRRFPGAVDLRINPSLGKADITWIPARGDLCDWLAEAERFGYRFGLDRKTPARRSREMIVRLAVTAAAAVHVMMFSLAYYFGLGPGDGALYVLLGRLSLALATVAVVAGGWVFLRGAARGLRRRMVHLDLPIAAGIVLAFGGSIYAYFRHGPQASYFDTVSVFITLMLVGRWLQERVLERNRNTLLADGGIEALYTRRVEAGALVPVPASAVRRGDELAVVPGDVVPVAGIVVERPARISLDWITGESAAVTAVPGETVPAGAFNAGDASIRLASAEDFADSRLVDLLRAPAPDAARGQGGTWWSRLATIYVAAVFALATAGFLLWIHAGSEKAIEVTVAVLVVTCPCALGLAVPLAQEMTHLALQRRGVFLRSGSFLDRALSVRKIVFDKTGTLTLGRLRPTPESEAALAALSDDARAALHAMVERSNHPVSRALAATLAGGVATPGSAAAGAEAVREIAGEGLLWERPEGTYRLGRPSFAASGPDTGGTHFSREGILLARLVFAEEIKGDAPAEVARLHEAGYAVHLLSGDRDEPVRRVAAALGIPPDRTRGGTTPEGKADWIRAVDRRDTLMVGDGLNDGPSFAAAWCAATPAVDHPSLPARADFYFLGEGIAAVRRALAAARRLRRITRDNLAFAVAYNAGALALCYLGRVSPVVAAVLMPLSSVAIVSITARRLGGRDRSWMS